MCSLQFPKRLRNPSKKALHLDSNRFAFKCHLQNPLLAITLSKPKSQGLECQCAKGTTLSNGSHPGTLKSPGKLRKY